MTELIAVSRAGPIATVVLNRPEKLNALTKSMWQALGAAIDALSADDALRCVILRGAGEKAFSPGNDIAEFATERANKAQAIDYGRIMHATAQLARRLPASAGRADPRHLRRRRSRDRRAVRPAHLRRIEPLRRADQESRPRHGLSGDGAAVRLAGADVALEILLEGRIFGAAEAKEKRLVTRVVPDAEVAAEVARDRAAHRRRRAARRALAQEVRAPARRIAADHGGRARRVLRLLRHRGLPDRLCGVRRQEEAGVRRP